MNTLARTSIALATIAGITWIALYGTWWARGTACVLLLAGIAARLWWKRDPHSL